jgi:dTDP-4-amino-4,6-dideoxygalactose transaminase
MPRFIDITSDTYTISVADLRKKKHELSAIIAVHMFGHMADMDELRAAAGNIPVIEDCAQSLFSTYKGVFAGDIASVSFFSFRSGKHLSVGEGSLIISKDSAMSAALKTEIATYGKWKKGPAAAHCLATWIKSVLYQRPWYGTIGYPIGIKLDKKLNLTAKSGFSVRRVAPGDFFLINKRLQSLRPHIKQQRLNALYYLDKMHNENLVFPFDKPYCESTYYQFALQTNSLEARNRLASHLRMHHIDAAKYLDEIAWEAKEKYGYTGDCPIAEKCSQTVVTVPVYYTLSTKDKAGIVDAVNSFTG